MRHKKKGKKLSRKKPHRNHMVRNLVTQLFLHGRIKTTLSKAKTAQPLAEKLTSLSLKKENPKKKLNSYLYSTQAVSNLVDEFKEDLKGRESGFTKIIKLGARKGDAAQMALLDLDIKEERKSYKKKRKEKEEENEDKEKSAERKPEPQDKKDKQSLWDRIRGKKKGPKKKKELREKESTQRTTNK